LLELWEWITLDKKEAIFRDSARDPSGLLEVTGKSGGDFGGHWLFVIGKLSSFDGCSSDHNTVLQDDSIFKAFIYHF
jgi:hypothetical protein